MRHAHNLRGCAFFDFFAIFLYNSGMLGKIKEEQKQLRREVKEKTLGYILAALGLVAGLAWNEAIKGLIEVFFPNAGGSVSIKFLYAFVITTIIVIVSIYLLRWTEKKEEK